MVDDVLARQYSERLSLLNDINQQITSILDLQELLTQITQSIRKTFNYYHVAIGLVEGEDVVYRQGSGTLWDDPGFSFQPSRLKIGSEGISGWVAGSGQSLIIPDVSKDPRYVWMQGSQTRSELTLPLVVKGSLIGVLDIQSDQPDDFDETDLEFMQSLANQAGIAIENARLYASAQHRAEQFRVITEVSQQITSTTDIGDLLLQVARLIRQTFDYYHVGIGLIEGEEVVYRVGAGVLWESPDFRFNPSRLKVGFEGITGWVAKTGEAVVVPDVSQDPRYVWLQGSLTRSELVVPITVKGQTIGVLDVQSEKLNDFDQTDRELMQSLANQTGIAIEEARHFADLERRAEQFRVLTEVSQHIISLMSLDELLRIIARTVKESFDYLHVGIGLVEGNEVVSKVETGTFEERYRSARISVGQGVWGWVAQHGEALVTGAVTGDVSHAQYYEEGVHSHVCVPLKVKDTVIGVMSASSDRPNAFDQSDEIILQTLANQASAAIENARLYEQEKRIGILEERQRLGRELHDSVTQSLYGINLYAKAAEGQMELGKYDQVRQYLGDIQNTAQESLAEMRLLIYELRPPILEREGLVSALQNRLYSVEHRAGLKTSLESNLAGRLLPGVEEGLYRIAHEALNNTLKHSRAAEVMVSILQEGQVITLEVADNGVGFDPVSAGRDGCLGLATMRERALGQGWQFTVDSKPGSGTRIRVEARI